MYVCMYECIYICICIYIYVCIYVYVCMYVYILYECILPAHVTLAKLVLCM